jgi:hypothetical protein
MPLRRRQRKRDTTPCTVEVAPNTLVFWDGQQRSGVLHRVPKHTAMHWLRQRWVRVVYEPVGCGDARGTPTRAPASDSVDHSPAASPPQPPTQPTFADDDDVSLLDSSASADDEQADEPVDTAYCDKTAGRGAIPSPDASGQPGHSGDLGPYSTEGFCQTPAEPLPDTAADQWERPERGVSEPVHEGVRTRTGTRTNPYGPGRCANCGSPVTGRRKWCDEACRLQAYRARP